MSRDRFDAVRDEPNSFGGATSYPVIRHIDPHAVFAYRGRQPITVERFLHDVQALAAYLPARKYVINLCADRYRFAVGTAAALCRRQVSLLPPTDVPGVLRSLVAEYADVYCLADTARPPVPSVAYPEDLGDGSTQAVPSVPAQQLALILFTSGSTGRPKPSAKSWGTLVRSARAAGERLRIATFGAATVTGTVPHQHSYGLESTILLPLQHGLAIDASRPFYPADIRATLDTAPRPRILVTTPVHIRALLAEAGGTPPLDLILSATAPLPTGLAARAEADFGAPLLEIYGCTEAGQLATRRTARESEWRCLDGVNLRQDGRETWASGPAVSGEVSLQDAIEPTGPATFRLGGRLSDLIDVAGKHVSLAHLNHQLLGIPGVEDGIFVMPDEGDESVRRPMAFVVAPGLDADAILRTLRDRIDAAFLPRPLVLVAALPRNALGKLPREALLALVRQGRG